MVRATWLGLGAYFVYIGGLLGANTVIALREPEIAPVSATLATVALVLPLIPLKRHGFLSF